MYVTAEKFIIDLKDNPCRKAGSIGKGHAGEKGVLDEAGI